MKKILSILVIMLGLCHVWAQQDSTIIDYSYDEYNKKEFHYSHTDYKCAYLINSAYRYAKVGTAMANKLNVKPCPYCTLGTEYTVKTGKVYVPIYISNIHEVRLNSTEESSAEWTEAEGNYVSTDSSILISVAHERLTNAKLSDIQSAKQQLCCMQ